MGPESGFSLLKKVKQVTKRSSNNYVQSCLAMKPKGFFKLTLFTDKCKRLLADLVIGDKCRSAIFLYFINVAIGDILVPAIFAGEG